MDLLSLDRGRPPATRVLAEPLPWGHPPLWITQQCLPLTRMEKVFFPNLIQKLHTTANMQSSVRATMCHTVIQAPFKEPRPSAQVRFKQTSLPISVLPFLSLLLKPWHVIFDPGRRQAVPLQCVRGPVQPPGQPQDSHSHSLRREALPLWHLRRSICSSEGILKCTHSLHRCQWVMHTLQ